MPVSNFGASRFSPGPATNESWRIAASDNSLSFEAWIHPTAFNGLARLLYFQDTVFVSVSVSGFDFEVGNLGYNPVAYTFALNTTYYIAATYDNASKVRAYYVNGSLVGSRTETGANPNPSSNTSSTSANFLTIAANAAAGTASYTGAVGEVALYKSVLTPARILAHYNAGVATSIGKFAEDAGLGTDAALVSINSIRSVSASESGSVGDNALLSMNGDEPVRYVSAGETGMGAEGNGIPQGSLTAPETGAGRDEATVTVAGTTQRFVGERSLGADGASVAVSVLVGESDAGIIVAARLFGASVDDNGERGAGADEVSVIAALTVAERGGIGDAAVADTGSEYFPPNRPGEGMGAWRESVSLVKTFDTTPPPAPTGLTVAPITGGRFTLAWNTIPIALASDVAYYNVQINGVVYQAVTHVPGVPTASLSQTPVYPVGERVRFSVTAVDASGNESVASGAVYGTVVAGSVPGGNFTYAAGIQKITVYWQFNLSDTSDPKKAAVAGKARQIAVILNGKVAATAFVRGNVSNALVRGVCRATGLLGGATYTLSVQVRDLLGAVTTIDLSNGVTVFSPAEGTVTATQLAGLLDGQATEYLVIKGNATYGGGEGEDVPIGTDRALSKRAREQEARILETQSYIVMATLLQVAHDTVQNSTVASLTQSILGRQVQSFDALSARLGVTGVGNLVGLLRYFNGGSAGAGYQCLVPPEFAELHSVIAGAGVRLSAQDVYHPAGVVLATLPGAVTGTINTGDYAGAARLVLSLIGTGSGNVNVTVTTKNGATGAIVAGVVLTGTVPTLTGNPQEVIVAPPAGCVITVVSSIAFTGSVAVSAGTLKTTVPTGRATIVA